MIQSKIVRVKLLSLIHWFGFRRLTSDKTKKGIKGICWPKSDINAHTRRMELQSPPVTQALSDILQLTGQSTNIRVLISFILLDLIIVIQKWFNQRVS